MREVKINLNTIEKVKLFVTIISKYPSDCDIVSESRKYVIDAKSIMGIFSLDLSKNLILVIHTDNDIIASEIEEAISDFKVA